MPKQAPSLRCDFGKGYGPDASWGSTYNLPTVTRDLNGCAVQVQTKSAHDSAARLAPGEGE